MRWCDGVCGGVLRCCGAAAHVAHAIDAEAQDDTSHREDVDRRRAENGDGARVEGGHLVRVRVRFRGRVRVRVRDRVRVREGGHRRDEGDGRACLEGAAQLAWLGLG